MSCTPHEVARECAVMYERLVEMRGSVSWNHLTGLWHASANLPHDEFGSTSGCYTSADTPEAAVAESHAEWVRLGRPRSDKSTEEQREYVRRWADEREENERRGAALREAAPVVSDAEAEATADSLVGQPVDSHVPRAYVGPGPERLKARFRW